MGQDRGPKSRQATSISRMVYGKAQFKKKLQQKRDAKVREKAKMLRDYAKLCQREGIVSDRVHIGPKVEKTNETPQGHKKPKPAIQSSLIKKYEQVSQQKAEEKVLREAAIESKEADREARLSKREEDNKKRRLKTKKGQPILGNQVKSILEKLQK